MYAAITDCFTGFCFQPLVLNLFSYCLLMIDNNENIAQQINSIVSVTITYFLNVFVSLFRLTGPIRFHAAFDRRVKLLDGVTGATVKFTTRRSGYSFDLHTGTGYV